MNIIEQIEKLIGRQPKDIRDEVEQQLAEFWDSYKDDDGKEFCDAFNRIIPSGPFSLGFPRKVYSSCQELLISALVLAKIFCIEDVGWDGLNMDAKGFCLSLIEAEPPADATASDLRALLTANQVVALLLITEKLDHPTPRNYKLPPPPWSKEGMANQPFDE